MRYEHNQIRLRDNLRKEADEEHFVGMLIFSAKIRNVLVGKKQTMGIQK